MSKSNENLQESIQHNWQQIQSRKNTDNYEVYELEIEKHLKELLEKIITFLEKFIISQSEVEFIEQKLHDYENMPELIKINMEIFNYLEDKIIKKIKSYKKRLKKKEENKEEGENKTEESETLSNSNNESFNQGEYEKLERQIQKYENEIRNHIRIEQQLKLYAESLSEKSTNAEKEKIQVEIMKNNEIQELKKQIEQSKNDCKKKDNELIEAKQQLQEQKEIIMNLNANFFLVLLVIFVFLIRILHYKTRNKLPIDQALQIYLIFNPIKINIKLLKMQSNLVFNYKKFIQIYKQQNLFPQKNYAISNQFTIKL